MKIHKQRFTIVDIKSGAVLKENILKENINAWLSKNKYNLKETLGEIIRVSKK